MFVTTTLVIISIIEVLVVIRLGKGDFSCGLTK